MAKKRRKHEEEEEFELPEFDEKEFLRKELVGAKIMLVTVVLAVIAAGVSYAFTLANVVVIAFFAGLALVFLLPYIVKFFRIETKGYTKKDWFGHGTTFFFAWLAIWVLLMNVPFADVTPPNLEVSVEGGSYSSSSASWHVNGTADRFNVTAIATDNAGIKDVKIVIGTSEPVDMSHIPNGNMWTYTVNPALPWNAVSVTVTTEDTSGHSVTVSLLVQRP